MNLKIFKIFKKLKRPIKICKIKIILLEKLISLKAPKHCNARIKAKMK